MTTSPSNLEHCATEETGTLDPSLTDTAPSPKKIKTEEELGDPQLYSTGVLLLDKELSESDSDYAQISFKSLSEPDHSEASEDGGGYDDDEEAQALVSMVHEMGPLQFIAHQKARHADPRVLLETLGATLLDIEDDAILWSFLGKFLLRYVYVRPRLDSCCSLDKVVSLIASSTKIAFLTGAGISVSSGVPDFRSAGGLYAQIQGQYALPEPECMFDIQYFRHDPKPFFAFAREIMPGQYEPSATHRFIRRVEVEGKLLRQYTQNIDTIEEIAGIQRVIYCHGSFATATCMACGFKYSFEQVKGLLASGDVAYCTECSDTFEDVLGRKNIVKPDIVFFGEPLPKIFDTSIEQDVLDADLLIVIGSSLKVQPVASIPDFLPPKIPQILINREPILDHNFDVELLGNADEIIREISRRLGWLDTNDEVPFETDNDGRYIFPGAIIENSSSSEDSCDDDDVEVVEIDQTDSEKH